MSVEELTETSPAESDASNDDAAAGVEDLMSATCEAHQFEAATDTCRACGYDFCPECLVYPMGESRPPYCVPCALSVSGVRSTAGRAPRAKPSGRLAHSSGSMVPRVAAAVVLAGGGVAAALTVL